MAYTSIFVVFSAIWIIVSAICSVVLNFFTEFYSIVTAIITFTSCSLCASIVIAIAVNLYPTSVRAMATCFIFMFGRIGGLAGGNLIGFLIENNCNIIFYAFGGLSLSTSLKLESLIRLIYFIRISLQFVHSFFF